MSDQPREEQNYRDLYCGLLSNTKYILKNPVKSKVKPAAKEIFTVKAQKEMRKDYNDVDYCCNDQDFDFINRYLQNNEAFMNKYGSIAVNLYELILDRTIKEWKVFQLTLIKKYTKERNCHVLNKQCDICTSSSESNANSILTCNGCNIHVHQDCYGVPNIDKFHEINSVKNRAYFLDALWFCRKCLFFPDKVPRCKYCLSEGGAYKQIYNSKRWAHVLCVHFIDTLAFSNTIFLEPVEELKDGFKPMINIGNIEKKFKKEDYYKTCFSCRNVRGRVLKCAYKNCELFYHVSCGINALFYFDMKNKISYCDIHDPENLQEENKSGDMILHNTKEENTIKRSNYKSLKHRPEIRKKLCLKFPEETFIFRIYHMKPRFTEYMANRILANDLCHFTDELITNFLLEIGMFWNIKCNRYFEIQDILSMDKSNIDVWNKNRSMLCMMNSYEKEFYQNFVNDKLKELEKNKKLNIKKEDDTSTDEMVNKVFNDIIFSRDSLTKIKEVPIDFIDIILYHLRLVRSLFYRLRREEEANFQIFKIDFQLYSMISNYDKYKMFLMLNKLRKMVEYVAFEHPVSNDIAPNYTKLIKEPMCFKDISVKIYYLDYGKRDFKHDLSLIVKNCLTYNINNEYFLDLARALQNTVNELLEIENMLDSEDSLELFLTLSSNKQFANR